MKRIISLFLSIIIIVSVVFTVNLSAYAEELAETGSLTESITWTFDKESGALAIEGTGKMPNIQALAQI